MKLQKLSMLTLSMIAASALLASTASLAAAANYKGDYKGEMPAAPCPQEKGLSDGFYLGVGGGYDSYRVRQNVARAGLAGTTTANPPLDATGFEGGIFAGYGQYINNSTFYLGAELFGNWSNANASFNLVSATSGNLYHTNTSIKGSYGIDILPGVKLNNNSLLYLRGGYIRTKFQINESAPTFSSSNSNWQNGWNYGVGLESGFYENWSVRTEYTHANFSSFTNGTSQTNVSPSDNQFVIGVLYHFA